MVSVLFPGRHHLLTNFQYTYLRSLVDQGIDGEKVDKIIFAVTSANHANTRRNPMPLYQRAIAIEKFSRDLQCEVKIYPIPDVQHTDKFAKYTLSQIDYQSQEKLNPENTVVACSTPELITQFQNLGFKNLGVELIEGQTNKYATLRPWEVITLLNKSGENWRKDNEWKKYTSAATQDTYLEYDIGNLINELFSDSLLTEDADITETRDYNSYAKGMDQNISFKFNDIKPFVMNGKIVDSGCGTGGLINLLAKNFPESDIIGIEATRKFYEHCKMQDYGDSFVFFYRKNILNQNFKENTINTFIYSSVLHEIYSYIGVESLRGLLTNTNKQLVPGGRIVIRDVVGPENGNETILMKLNEKDGTGTEEIHTLSTYNKFFKFTQDFKPRKIDYNIQQIEGQKYIQTTLQNAYEYMSKMNYVDNWDSEMHEEFGFWNFNDWKSELEKTGYDIVEGSKTFSSQYIVDHMYKGKVELYKMTNERLDPINYPPTNMILAAEKRHIE
jgi:SAM-dependent methyltransferase